ncbi:MAG: undecaprenyl/decaprenyl-phosphate alpha-N-acetylglucosaminyl 1-phosphate transferase [Campylobacterales bacterium]|nr:undecaprenyl/decaprenyl-phosphate alpha-N-acetylglucosaminyl 1-phosphate transferase [Campylobacterales bacterium]
MQVIQFLSSFVLSAVLISLLIRFAPKLRLVDIPNDRSSHKRPVPKGAGIGFTLAALYTAALTNIELVYAYPLTFASIVLVLVAGILDDIKNCRPRMKFTVLLFAVIMLYYDHLAINWLGDFMGLHVTLHWLLVLPFTYFAVVGFTNALNLIDGIDGLAGGVSLVILSTLLIIGITYDDPFITAIAGSFVAALAAFMLFNWNPARVFMGDSGSITLGFVIALLSIKALDYMNPTVILFIAALPILDTMNVMRRRKQRKQSLFKADKNHLHHILLNQKRDVPFTSTILILMQIVFSVIGYRSIGQDDTWNVVLFIILFIIFFNLFDPRMRRRKKKKKSLGQHVIAPHTPTNTEALQPL